MFSIFKKNIQAEETDKKTSFEIELTACVLAYEVARSDGNISKDELKVLLNEIKKITIKVGKSKDEILNIIEEYSKNSVSFYEFIEDINKDFSKEEKLFLIQFLWDIAYADAILEVNEERLVRRIADLINIKDLEVLKLKDRSKSHKLD
jgi:uncharacterized tellurite resistance protein B-like protein